MQNSNNRQDVKLPHVASNDNWKNKVKLRKFETFKQVYDATSNNQEYKDMRRAIKPSM